MSLSVLQYQEESVRVSENLIFPCIMSLNPGFLPSSFLFIMFNTEGLLISVSIKITFPILENAKAVFKAIVVFPSPE